jgi:hypothetical protein
MIEGRHISVATSSNLSTTSIFGILVCPFLLRLFLVRLSCPRSPPSDSTDPFL